MQQYVDTCELTCPWGSVAAATLPHLATPAPPAAHARCLFCAAARIPRAASRHAMACMRQPAGPTSCGTDGSGIGIARPRAESRAGSHADTMYTNGAIAPPVYHSCIRYHTSNTTTHVRRLMVLQHHQYTIHITTPPSSTQPDAPYNTSASLSPQCHTPHTHPHHPPIAYKPHAL